jgi:hypothetical protein
VDRPNTARCRSSCKALDLSVRTSSHAWPSSHQKSKPNSQHNSLATEKVLHQTESVPGLLRFFFFPYQLSSLGAFLAKPYQLTVLTCMTLVEEKADIRSAAGRFLTRCRHSLAQILVCKLLRARLP